MKLLIVVSPYYKDIADHMIAGAKAEIEAAGGAWELVEVPGALEVPTAISIADRRSNFDGYVALGCVIRGETTHYDTVCNDSSRALQLLGLQGLAIGNGILTVENHAQAAVRADPAGQSAPAVIEEFETHRFGATYEGAEYNEGDVDLFRQLVNDAVNWQAKIDQMTDRALVAKWPIARIDPTLRALFRAAGAELTQSSTPPKVVITEFVDVARAFFEGGDEPKFVNAVLDHMAREAMPEAF